MISPSDFHSDERTVVHYVNPSNKGFGHAHRRTQRAIAAPSFSALPLD